MGTATGLQHILAGGFFSIPNKGGVTTVANSIANAAHLTIPQGYYFVIPGATTVLEILDPTDGATWRTLATATGCMVASDGASVRLTNNSGGAAVTSYIYAVG